MYIFLSPWICIHSSKYVIILILCLNTQFFEIFMEFHFFMSQKKYKRSSLWSSIHKKAVWCNRSRKNRSKILDNWNSFSHISLSFWPKIRWGRRNFNSLAFQPTQKFFLLVDVLQLIIHNSERYYNTTRYDILIFFYVFLKVNVNFLLHFLISKIDYDGRGCL